MDRVVSGVDWFAFPPGQNTYFDYGKMKNGSYLTKQITQSLGFYHAHSCSKLLKLQASNKIQSLHNYNVQTYLLQYIHN